MKLNSIKIIKLPTRYHQRHIHSQVKYLLHLLQQISCNKQITRLKLIQLNFLLRILIRSHLSHLIMLSCPCLNSFQYSSLEWLCNLSLLIFLQTFSSNSHFRICSHLKAVIKWWWILIRSFISLRHISNLTFSLILSHPSLSLCLGKIRKILRHHNLSILLHQHTYLSWLQL